MSTLEEREDPAPEVVEHKWAEASVDDLRAKMRLVFEQREEAERKGARARQDMMRLYVPQAFGDLLVREFKRIAEKQKVVHNEL